MKWLLLILSLFTSVVLMKAQKLIHYTNEDNLPSNLVYEITQDNEGYIWIGTSRGISKFDGQKFKNFNLEDGLKSVDVWKLKPNEQNKLWFYSYAKKNGFIANDSVQILEGTGNKLAFLEGIYTHKDTTWIHQRDFIRTYIGKELISTQSREEICNKLSMITHSNAGHRCTNADSNVAQINNHLVFIDSNTVKLATLKGELLKERLIPNYDQLSNYNYFLGPSKIGTDKLIFLFLNGIVELSLDDFSLQTRQLPEPLEFRITKIHPFKNGFQCTSGTNLYVFNENFEIIKQVKSPIKTKNIQHLFLDKDENLWISTTGDGLYLVPYSAVTANYLLPNKNIHLLYKTNQGIIAGASNDFYYLLDDNNQLKKISDEANKLHLYGYRIRPEENDTLLFDSHTIKQLKNGRLRNYQLNSLIPSLSWVKDYYYSEQLKKAFFSRNGELIEESEHGYKSLGGTNIMHIEEIDNRMYFGGGDGLFVLENNKLSLPNIEDIHLLELNVSNLLKYNNQLVVGTGGRGIYFFDGRSIHHVDSTDGLIISDIFNQGNTLWLATDHGVHQLKVNSDDFSKSQIVDSYFVSDGLLENNTNVVLVDDDTLYVGSDSGLSQIDLSNPIYRSKPKFVFQSKKDSLLYDVKQAKNIVITYNPLEFVKHDNLQFTYRILPIDSTWVPTTSNAINLSYLKPGSYDFQLRAQDQHGNETTKTKYLSIVPAWWQTGYAHFGIGFIIIIVFSGLIYMVYLYRNLQLERKKSLNQKMAGLELQALRSQMNPHFVHNSLNAIQYYVQRHEVELSENYLSQFSQLIRSFFEYSRLQSITLQDEIYLLDNYIQIEKLRFENKLDYEIIVDPTLDIEDRKIPTMILQPIVENAINHGLFHKLGNGKITIQFTKLDDSSFKVEIIDDGIGVNRGREIREKSSTQSHSNSSEVLEERLQLLNKSKNWYIDYNIVDRSNLDPKLEGTRVQLVFNKTTL